MDIFLKLLPLLLKLLGWILGRSEKLEVAKRKFLEMIPHIESSLGIVVKLNDSDRSQTEDIRNQFEDHHRRLRESNTKKKYVVPVIEEINTNAKLLGRYSTASGLARGLTIHTTAGRRTRGRIDAINTLLWMTSMNLAAIVMDIDGKLYKPVNMKLSHAVNHAGKSKWNGVEGLNSYCIPLEICCAGKLTNINRTSWRERIPLDDVRVISDGGNRIGGHYQKLTVAQEESLFNFCLWQMDVNPEFNVDWIVGHDEIAIPNGRKTDPGGSLSMTTAEFRIKLRERMG